MSVNTKCQVFTPQKTVKQLLDFVGYKKDLYGKKVAENSCGDGNVLVEIVERYITDCIKNNLSENKIKFGLENDIWGAEIDKKHIKNCKIKLDMIANQFGIIDVNWNIFEGDFLKANIINSFDFVIGNPPYITYKELKIEEREFIKFTFETCKSGKFDYCYAFIEASMKSLKSSGKLGYLIPSNIFKNQFALKLRSFILPNLTDIYDFTNQKLFTGKLTSSAIIVCDRSKNRSSFKYHNLIRKELFSIDKKRLTEKWIFEQKKSSISFDGNLRFGDYFHAASSIATLLNEVYILSDFKDCGDYIQVKDQLIEKSLVREATSPRAINYNKKELVVFPYYYNSNGLQRYSSSEFEKNFPYGVKYLQQFKDKLNKRNSDCGISWYEYGRSQALSHLNQEKILISTLITGNVKVSLLGKYVIPTSGIYIIPKNGQQLYSLEDVITILESNCFLKYVKSIGVISNGNSFRISSKDINNFMFSAELFH